MNVSAKFHPAVILLFIGVVVFGSAVTFGFVWDDLHLIVDNQKLQNPSILIDFFTKDFWENASNGFKSGFYRPLTWTSFFINYHLWQAKPFGFHLFNIIIHIVNAILIYSLFFTLTKHKQVAFLTAIFFLVHPVQSEVVCFIANVGDLLCVLFLLLCCLSYVQYAEKGRRIKDLVFSNLFLCLAFLSKENAMIGAGLVMLTDFYFISKLNWKMFRQKIPIFLSFVSLTCVYILWRAIILGKLNAITTLSNVRYVSILPSFDAWTHFLTISKILFLYLKMFLWPVDQSISYVVLPAIDFFSWDVMLPIFVLSILFLLIFSELKPKREWTSFALVWFFMTLLPVSNLIPISNTIAERFMYLPVIGLCFLLASSLIKNFERRKGASEKKSWYAIVAFIILAFSGFTMSRNFVWKSNYTLFASARNEIPCSAVAHFNLSVYYKRQGDLNKEAYAYHRYLNCTQSITKQYRRLKKLYQK